MRTTNFLNLAALLFERCSTNKGILPCKACNGTTYYLTPAFNSGSFPQTVTLTFALNETAAGFSVGSGTTAATEDDYCLETPITSGLSASVVINPGLDNNGNPQVAYDLTITNTGESDITISEIGFKQNLYATTTLNGTSASARVCLLDRTVLDTAVTIEAGDIAVIRYTLKTDMT